MQIDYLQRNQDLDNLITVIHNLSQMKTALFMQEAAGQRFSFILVPHSL